MKTRHSIVFFLCSVCAVSAWSNELPYRLAGTVMSSDGNRIAIVEIANGEQRLLKIGEPFDGGVIKEIKEKSAVYELDNTKYIMNLKGTGLLVESASIDPAIPTTDTREFSDKTIGLLENLRNQSDDSNENVFREKLNQILNLPEATRIKRVNHEPVVDSVQALIAIIDAIEKRNYPRLDVDGMNRTEGIYMVPEYLNNELMTNQ